MKCIFCKNKETYVINSRKTKHASSVWRRRECATCKKVFTTEESLSPSFLHIAKRNGSHCRFVYEKLFTSILYAIDGGKRRDSGDQALTAKRLTARVIDLLVLNQKIIASKDIIKIVYSILKNHGEHASLRYMMYSDYRLKVLNESKQ